MMSCALSVEPIPPGESRCTARADATPPARRLKNHEHPALSAALHAPKREHGDQIPSGAKPKSIGLAADAACGKTANIKSPRLLPLMYRRRSAPSH